MCIEDIIAYSNKLHFFVYVSLFFILILHHIHVLCIIYLIVFLLLVYVYVILADLRTVFLCGCCSCV